MREEAQLVNGLNKRSFCKTCQMFQWNGHLCEPSDKVALVGMMNKVSRDEFSQQSPSCESGDENQKVVRSEEDVEILKKKSNSKDECQKLSDNFNNRLMAIESFIANDFQYYKDTIAQQRVRTGEIIEHLNNKYRERFSEMDEFNKHWKDEFKMDIRFLKEHIDRLFGELAHLKDMVGAIDNISDNGKAELSALENRILELEKVKNNNDERFDLLSSMAIDSNEKLNSTTEMYLRLLDEIKNKTSYSALSNTEKFTIEKKPYKCPVCDGARGSSAYVGSPDPFFVECRPCEGKGIVWG